MPARFPGAFRRAAGRQSQKDSCATCGSRPSAQPIARSRHACSRAQWRDSTRTHATRRTHGPSPQTPPAPASLGRLVCSRARRRPARPRTAPLLPSIRPPPEFTKKRAEDPRANFTVHPRTQQRSGALHRHGRRQRPQLLLRGAFGGGQLSARGLADLFNLGPSRSAQPLRLGCRIPPCRFAQFRDFLVEPRNLRLDLAQFAVRLGLRRLRFGDAGSYGLRVGTEKRPTALRDQVADPAEDKNEVEPAENEPGAGCGRILRRGFAGQRRERRKNENHEPAREEPNRAPPGFHRTSTRRAPPGTGGIPARMVSTISPARAPLDCSSCVRAASTSAASAFFAPCNSCCAAERAALTAACRSSRTWRRAASCSAKISPRTLRSASLYARSFSCTAARLDSASLRA